MSKGFAQGPNVAARVKFEPATIRTYHWATRPRISMLWSSVVWLQLTANEYPLNTSSLIYNRLRLRHNTFGDIKPREPHYIAW